MRSATRLAAASIDSRCVMSQSKQRIAGPARLVSSSNLAVGTALSISSAATRAPASMSASVHTAPSLPLAPVTTAMRLSREKRPFTEASRTRELGVVRLAQHVEREEVILVQRLECGPANDLVEIVWRDATSRRFHDHVLRADHMARRQVSRDDEALAHLDDWRVLAVVELFLAVAHRLERAIEVADHLAQADRLERERMVGAFHRAIQREMFFDDARTEHVGGEGHGDAVVVARETHDRLREMIAIGADHSQVEFFERRRISRGALKNGEL